MYKNDEKTKQKEQLNQKDVILIKKKECEKN